MALSDDSIFKIENLTEFGDGCLANFQQLVNSEIEVVFRYCINDLINGSIYFFTSLYT